MAHALPPVVLWRPDIADEGGSPRAPGVGRRGDEAFNAGGYGGDTGGTCKADLRFVAADDEGRVVGVHHNSAERDGEHLDTGCCIVFKLVNGRIVHGREHFYDQRNWDEFWS